MSKDKDDSKLNLIKGEFNDRKYSNIPRMPAWFSPEMKFQWRRIMKMLDKTTLHPGDAIGLSLLCGVMADHSRVKKELRDRGGEVPELVEILSEYNEQIVVWCREFLITPASRRSSKDIDGKNHE